MSARLWLLVILVCVGAFAPSRADARGVETCAQGFFATATTACPQSEPQVAGTHQGFAACGYELASGYSQAAESAGGNLVNVIHFSDQAGADAIQASGALRAGSYVTLPSEVEGMTQAKVEEFLEIQPGRGATSTTIQVPQSQLVTPPNGPFTSGGATQFQITVPTPPGTFVPTPQ